MSEWQPIETAPKDGTEILAYSSIGDTDVMLVRFIAPCEFLTEAEVGELKLSDDAEVSDWFYADFVQAGRLSWDCYPTHWMPLPPAP